MMVEKQTESFVERIGRYNVLKKLGDGGMGSVYLAIDPKIHRKVAIKVFKLEKIKQDKEALKRFYLEAEAIGKLAHPNIVTIFDIQDEKDEPYLVMEYLEGETLSSIINQKKILPIPLIIDIALQLCDALHYAHSNGIIHRDIKPGNIILLANNKVKLTDFGIAKFQSLADAPQVTKTGIIIGTPSYMSPEQISGNPIDQRSDIFSLAVVIWELLTGRRAFDADSIATIAFKVVYDDLPPADKYNPNIPKELSRVLTKALVKKPEKRYSNVQELRVELENLRNSNLTLQFESLEIAKRAWYAKPFNIAVIIFLLIIALMISYYWHLSSLEYQELEESTKMPIVDYIEQSHNLIQNNKIEGAIDLLKKAEANFPEDIKIKKMLALAQQRKEDYDGAVDTYFRLIRDFPSEVGSVMQEAMKWHESGLQQQANKLVQQIKNQYPSNKEVNDFIDKVKKGEEDKLAKVIVQKQDLQKGKPSNVAEEHKGASMDRPTELSPDVSLNKSLFGFVNIRCYPPAEVFIDKRSAGKSPLINYKLPVGKHSIRLKTANNQIYEKNIFIFSGKTEEIYYNFESYAKIFVQCGENSYKVYIDNNYVGVTPYYNEKVPAGKHTVIIEKASGQRETKYVFLKPNTMETIKCSSP